MQASGEARRSLFWPLLAWTAASIPATGIAAGVLMAAYTGPLGQGGGGFFSLGNAPALDFFLGARVGLVWAGMIAVPNLAMLRLWVALARLFGDTDVSRVRILAGMILWALPQAFVVGAIEGWSGFAAAWIAVAFGLWLPRAVLKGLRPGVFG